LTRFGLKLSCIWP